MSDLVFIDVETTGLDATIHEAIEVAVIRTDPSGVDVKQVLDMVVELSPTALKYAEAKALEVNGYNAPLWEGAVRRDVAALEVHKVMSEARVVGVNPGFDDAFLKKLLREVALKPSWSHRLIDVGSMAHPLQTLGLLSPETGLTSLCHALGVTPEPAVHRAINGAYLARTIYLKLLAHYRTALSGHKA